MHKPRLTAVLALTTAILSLALAAPAGAVTVTKVATSTSGGCALLSTGIVRCWGANNSGQLGNGTKTNSYSPVSVTGITDAVDVSVGSAVACAVLSGGTIKCWGSHQNYLLGNGTNYGCSIGGGGGGGGFPFISGRAARRGPIVKAGYGSSSTCDSSTPVSVSYITNATKVAIAGQHACALLSTGNVQCWGNQSNGELGNGLSSSWSNTPVSVSQAAGFPSTPLANATAVATGANHSCARISNGTVRCWGWNSQGFLGTGNTTSLSTATTPMTGVSDATAVAADTDGAGTCVLIGSGKVKCAGNNYIGQLGNGTTGTSSQSTAVLVQSGDSDLSGATALSAAGGRVCAVMPGATLSCWGQNNLGQLGDGTTTNQTKAVTISGLSGVTGVGLSQYMGCAIVDSGAGIKCWGTGYLGSGGSSSLSQSAAVSVINVFPKPLPSTPVLTDAPSGTTKSTTATIGFTADDSDSFECSVDGGAYEACTSPKTINWLTKGSHSLAVKAKNTEGYSPVSTATWSVDIGTTLTSATEWKSISAGVLHSCGVTLAGEGHCWGANYYGQTTVPEGKTWDSIAGGYSSSCGVTASGEGFCWGDNSKGQTNLPAGKTWKSFSTTFSTNHNCGVTTAGEGLCWGTNTYGQMTVPTGKTWDSISAGSALSCGVTTTGEGFCWSVYGSIINPPTGKTWANITAGSTFACGVTTTGEGRCWGATGPGMVVPTVPTGKTWTSMTAGYSTVCGFTTIGEGFCWGSDDHGQATIPTGKTWKAMTGPGYYAGCGLTTDNHAWCWGDNSWSQVQPWESLVDTTPPAKPTLALVTPAGSPTNSKSASISISAEVGATLTCSLDGGAYAACTSPKSLSNLAAGSHTLSVKATDAALNTSAAGTLTWVIDLTAPAAPVITGGPGASTAEPTATLTWTGEVGATFQCRLDTGTWAACTSPKALTGIALGDHTFSVKATDAAGNTGATATRAWKVSQAPVVSPTVKLTATIRKDGANNSWFVNVGSVFSAADSRASTQPATVQIWTSNTVPSDSAPIPSAPTYASGILKFTSPEVKRPGGKPTYVRVGSKAGKWTGWIKVS